MRWQAVMFGVLLCFRLAACTTAVPDEAAEGEQRLNVSLDTVEAGTAVLLGSFDCSGGTLHYSVEAEEGSGLFVGLYHQAELPEGTITWERYVAGDILPFTGDEKTITITEGVSDLSGTYYVYVGSSGTDLSHVTGTVRYAPAD